MPRLDSVPPETTAARACPGERPRPIGRALARPITLTLHGLVRRLRLAPPEFGRDRPVDETDAVAVRAEWRRYLRLWARTSPQEIFALKLYGTLMAVALIALALGAALLM